MAPLTLVLTLLKLGDESGQENQGSVEGTPVWRTHRTYERNSRNRANAIVYHGRTCLGCGFSFDAKYTSEHARGYIEVHHIHPLSEGPRVVNPYEDLIPLCANCHRMVHRRGNRLAEFRRAKAVDREGERRDAKRRYLATMAPRNTGTGIVLEQMVLPALSMGATAIRSKCI